MRTGRVVDGRHETHASRVPRVLQEHAEKVLLLATHLAGRLLLADSAQPLDALHELVACLHDSLLVRACVSRLRSHLAGLRVPGAV
jgi:hypothetical protein